MDTRNTSLIALFSAISSNEIVRLKELLEETPTIVSETMPMEYIPIAYNWLAEFWPRKDIGIPIYIQTAIDMYSTVKLLEWSIQCKSFEAFEILLTFDAPFDTNEYIRAITETELCDDRWLKLLLCNEKNSIPFEALAYSLANFGTKSFHILYNSGCNIYETSNILKNGKQFTYGLFGIARTMEQVELLLGLSVSLHAGDFVYRLQNNYMNLEIFGFLLGKFTEEFQCSRKILELFDVENGSFITNKVIMDLVDGFILNIVEREKWKTTFKSHIESAVAGKFPSLQVLAFNSLKKNNEENLLCESVF